MFDKPRPGQCCTLCGRKVPAAKKTATLAPADTSIMTETELYAYFKKTGPIEDVRFALKHDLPMSEELRADWTALLESAPALSAAETRRRLYALNVRRFGWIDARNQARSIAKWARVAERLRIDTRRVGRLELDPARIPSAA